MINSDPASQDAHPTVVADIATTTTTTRRRDRSFLIASVSNIGIQYNFQAISVALKIMEPAYPRNGDWEESALKSLVFAGAICGQMVMGYAGDTIGRRNAMILTNFLTFFGALGSAILPWGNADTVYAILMACRFIIGVGVGGKYPLSAAMSKEADTTGEPGAKRDSNTDVAIAFFWQAPGAMLPYVVTLPVLMFFGVDNTDHAAVSAEFRIILGLGALPALIVLLLCRAQPESDEFERVKQQRSTVAQDGSGGAAAGHNVFRAAARHPEHWRRLVGTAIGWFLFDVLTYGTTINQPDIVDAVFGKNDTLWANCEQNLLVSSFNIPTLVLAIAMLKCMGTKRLQVWGFIAIGVVSLLFVVVTIYDREDSALNFAMLCLLISALAWGPNVTTYVLPAEVFPTEVRSSFFGVSAAMGKVGALIGGATFGLISEKGQMGLPVVFMICTAISGLGVAVTACFVEPYGKESFIGCGGGHLNRQGSEMETSGRRGLLE